MSGNWQPLKHGRQRQKQERADMTNRAKSEKDLD